jgi:hypothetical protein
MHVGITDLRVAARADRADHVALGDGRRLGRNDRAEMRERDREPVGGRDRDDSSRARDAAGERDGSRRRGAHWITRLRPDVDATMLARGVRVRRVEAERLEDRAAGGPRPGTRHRRDEQRGRDRDEQHTTHRHHLCCLGREQVFPG